MQTDVLTVGLVLKVVILRYHELHIAVAFATCPPILNKHGAKAFKKHAVQKASGLVKCPSMHEAHLCYSEVIHRLSVLFSPQDAERYMTRKLICQTM